MGAAENTAKDTSEPIAQPIRRSTFVYGKRKNAEPEQAQRDTVAHSSAAEPAAEWLPTPSHPQDSAGGRILPSTKRAFQCLSNASSDEESDDPGATSHFQFDFRRQMKEIDNGFDSHDEPLPQIPRAKSSPASPQAAEIPHSPQMHVQCVADALDTASLSHGKVLTSEGPSSGSLSSPRPSLPQATTSSLNNSPIISRLVKGRAKHPLVSDSESDPPSNSSSASPVRHSLNTPHLRSPPTPPTSEIEMPTTKKSSKAKGKAPVRSVPPLRFNSEDIPTNLFSGSENKGKRRENSGHRVKTKAPTKKERREAALESSRIAASRPVEVPRTDQAKYTMASFFARVQHAKPGARNPNTTLAAELPSDPIEKFSSPSSNPLNKGGLFGRPTGLLADSVPGTGGHADGQELANAAESSDEDMPPIGHIIRQEQEKPQVEALRQSLRAKKLALLQNRTGPSNVTEEDDDLEIVKDDMHSVAREAAAKRRADKSQRSPVKMKILAMAMGHKGISKVRGSGSKPISLPAFSEQQLKHLAKPVFARGSKAEKEGLCKQELDRMMMRQHEQEKLRLIKQREEEWIQKGGRVLREGESNNVQASLSQAVETYAHRALNSVAEAEGMDSGVGDDESDGDYIPSNRNSPSAELAVKAGGDSDSDREEHSMTISDQSAQLTDDEENVAPFRRNSGIRKSTRMVLGSDDEDNERQSGTSVSAVGGQDAPQNRGSTSSTGSQTEDENDKENNTKLMFDRSEDKENKAVIRHSPVLTRPALGLRVEPLFPLEGGAQQRSSSAASPTNYDHMAASQKETVRTPLRELSREDDDPFLQPASAHRYSFTERLLRSRPSTPPRTISSPKQGLGSPASLRSERSRRHSLISSEGGNDENDAPGFKPQPLLLSFMETSVKRSPEACLMPLNAANRGLSQFFSDDDAGPRKVPSPSRNELSLTLDVGLQPALEVSSTLRCKADMIFEKEQEYVVAAAQKEQRPKEVLYVNDHGFLTQTRPEGESPQVYHMAPSQVSRYIGTQQVDATQRTAERVPLGTLSLSFTAAPGSPGPQPLRRLRRRSASPLPCTVKPASREPASMMEYPSRVNVFDVLGKASKRPKVPKEKLKDSEFVAAEAEESDEDDMFSFGGPKKDDEEEDGEDEAKVVEGLVDDTVMDVETERPDLIQEKFREHEAEDDQRREKFHQEVVEGKYRKKRLGRGLNLDEDSDDEEDEADRWVRQRMNKKRKIHGDNLEALGQNEETKAFYNTYHQDLVDDGDDEFKHLHDVPMDEDHGDDESEQESMTVSEVVERVREVARNPSVVRSLDPTNTDWIDESTADDPVGVRVKVMSRPTTRTTRRPNHGNVDFDIEAPKRSIENDSEQKQWISWARDQGGRHYGTGRSATGAAVTGHAKVKSGGGSLRSKATNGVGNESRAGSSRLSKAPSMLSAVSDRSSRFG